MRVTDSHEISQLNELKIDVGALSFIAHYLMAGNIIMDEQMPIFGGYAGGLEETAIVDVATHLNAFVMSQADYHLDGPIHVRWGNTTARETLVIAGHTAMAVGNNTHLLLANQYYPIAGPCTEMCLLETAAQAITDTVSGRELVSGSASAKGVALDYTTGMEARIMGEAALSTAGMEIEKVNTILESLVSSYEGSYRDAPKGKTFQECYDTVSITPTDEYLEVYQKAVGKMEKLGVSWV